MKEERLQDTYLLPSADVRNEKLEARTYDGFNLFLRVHG